MSISFADWKAIFRIDPADYELAHRWSELAAYNTRISQGIVHTPEYVEHMRREQAAFNAETEAERQARYAAARRVRA